MPKVLVTGGAGFIGSHICEEFEEAVALDDFSTGRKSNLPKNVKIIRGSVVNPKTVERAVKGADYVFHLAALVGVPDSIKRPQKTFEINSLGTLNILEAARKFDVKKVIFSSSAAIYGDSGKTDERALPNPKCPYALTKLDGEYLCRMYSELYNLNTVCLRYFNVYGERQNLKYAAAIPIFIRQALAGKPITVEGDGSQTRDFVYVKDIVEANKKALAMPNGVYNVGTGRSISILRLASLIKKLANSSSEIVFKEPRAGDIKESRAETIKILKYWRPRFGLEQGLNRTINNINSRG